VSHRGDPPVYRSQAARSSTAPVWGFVVLVLGLSGSAVLLSRAGLPVEGVAGLLVAIGASATTLQIALTKLAAVERRQRDIAARTQLIERRTNGEMASTIYAERGPGRARETGG
jgi:hypothetical protein